MVKLHVQPKSNPATKLIMSCPARADGPLANVRPSVPVRNALRLYVSGACRTKKEASTVAGLHPNYLTMLTGPNGSEPVRNLLAEMEAQLHDATLNMSHVMQYIARKGAMKVGLLIDSPNERIALDASKEAMDRSPETQKTQRLQVDSFTLDGKDAAALIHALTESASTAAEHAAAKDGIIELSIDNFERTEAQALPVQSTEGKVG